MNLIGASLTVIAFVGAASVDASPEQREQLKTAIEPLRDKGLTTSEAYGRVIKGVAAVMGQGWQPTGEWDVWITKLLNE